MEEERLAELFQKYIHKTATELERAEFFQLATQPEAEALLRKYSDHFEVREDQYRELLEDSSERILENILKSESNKLIDLQHGTVARPKRWLWYAAAVAILFIVFGGFYYWNTGREINNQMSIAGNQLIKDALPGHNGAILTLSNGKSFQLDSLKSGQVTTGFRKSSGAVQAIGGTSEYATLKTPFGRKQQLILSDGTNVWLNAGSSIRFPEKFQKNQRIVEVTGEAYFEVVHNEKAPFIVKVAGEQIFDLGTRFNVNAYENESKLKITLQEGSIQVGTTKTQILKPNEQYSGGQISKVNAQDAIAWVTGFFHFDHADIRTVMRQIARWYNVQVTFEGEIPPIRFGGDIQQSLKLSAVLDLLTESGIHYTLDGNQLTIRP